MQRRHRGKVRPKFSESQRVGAHVSAKYVPENQFLTLKRSNTPRYCFEFKGFILKSLQQTLVCHLANFYPLAGWYHP
jgi:hypothetical protein